MLSNVFTGHRSQGCENDIDSMVQTSASQILECVFELCRHCGELAIATETPMGSLRDTGDATVRQFGGKTKALFLIQVLLLL